MDMPEPMLNISLPIRVITEPGLAELICSSITHSTNEVD
jgi:hypothetical protein